MIEKNPGAGIAVLEAMRQGVNYRHEVKVREQKFRLRPLTNNEILDVTDEVLEIMNSLPVFKRHPQREHSLVARLTLMKASTPDVGSSEVGLTDYVLSNMSAEELQLIYNEYVKVCERVNPKLEEMPKEDLDFLVEDLKKSSNLNSQLTDLPISHLVSVCRKLILDARQMDS